MQIFSLPPAPGVQLKKWSRDHTVTTLKTSEFQSRISYGRAPLARLLLGARIDNTRTALETAVPKESDAPESAFAHLHKVSFYATRAQSSAVPLHALRGPED